MRENDELDRLIDSALSTYGDPGPDSGLDQRVLVRISSARASTRVAHAPRRRWVLWAIGLPAAACLLLFFLAGPKTAPPPTGVAKGASQPQELPTVPPHIGALPVPRHEPAPISRQLPSSQSRRSGNTTRAVALPKLDLFPTPQPLTPAEQALIDFALRAPESERKSFIAAHTQAEAPLRSSAIEIPPSAATNKDTN